MYIPYRFLWHPHEETNSSVLGERELPQMVTVQSFGRRRREKGQRDQDDTGRVTLLVVGKEQFRKMKRMIEWCVCKRVGEQMRAQMAAWTLKKKTRKVQRHATGRRKKCGPLLGNRPGFSDCPGYQDWELWDNSYLPTKGDKQPLFFPRKISPRAKMGFSRNWIKCK